MMPQHISQPHSRVYRIGSIFWFTKRYTHTRPHDETQSSMKLRFVNIASIEQGAPNKLIRVYCAEGEKYCYGHLNRLFFAFKQRYTLKWVNGFLCAIDSFFHLQRYILFDSFIFLVFFFAGCSGEMCYGFFGNCDSVFFLFSPHFFFKAKT